MSTYFDDNGVLRDHADDLEEEPVGVPVKSTSVRPCVSVPRALLDAYRAVAPPLPPLSTLLQNAMRTTLDAVAAEVPPRPAPAQTDAATRARWSR